MASTLQTHLEKLHSTLAGPVQYFLKYPEGQYQMNSLLGKKFTLSFTGSIECIHCGRKIKKTFNQGYCFPCSQKLAACDMCIVRPELCHFDQGTCREPQWGEEHCMRPHVVYLANASGAKVGITREVQVPIRWIDQGATQAMPVFKVQSRYHSGLVEAILKKFISDKTNWRNMLKGQAEPIDLKKQAQSLCEQAQSELKELKNKLGESALQELPEASVLEIQYPVLEYPQKIISLDLESKKTIEGTLLGIKGQYLIWDVGVLNVRKYTGYQVEFST